jgi:hypothetical protein
MARWLSVGSAGKRALELSRAEAALLMRGLMDQLLFHNGSLPSLVLTGPDAPVQDLIIYVDKQKPDKPGISHSEEPPTLPLWADSPRDR